MISRSGYYNRMYGVMYLEGDSISTLKYSMLYLESDMLFRMRYYIGIYILYRVRTDVPNCHMFWLRNKKHIDTYSLLKA